jgi:aminoglycoside/choline kinase family phosphotransferase
MPSHLEEQIRKLIPSEHTVGKIEKLFGEASYREYFRIHTKANSLSYILMKIPPGKQSVSEEITNYQGPKNELPFLNIQKYLEEQNLPVPHVISKDLEAGLLIIQDLGDKSLEKLLPQCNEDMRLYFYRQCIDLLIRLQVAGTDHPDPKCMAFNRSFDRTLLEWELNHFLEFGIEDRFGVTIPTGKKNAIQKQFQLILDPIMEIPQGLTHRDFQSRNLIYFGYEFFMIDFQDSLQGPPHYDLVALLRDSYVTLSEDNLELLMDYFWKSRKDSGLPVEDPEIFKRNFFLITLQRKLKDTGRFQFIHTVKGNSNFLTHVPDSLGYVRHAFSQLPELKSLRQLLSQWVTELR